MNPFPVPFPLRLELISTPPFPFEPALAFILAEFTPTLTPPEVTLLFAVPPAPAPLVVTAPFEVELELEAEGVATTDPFSAPVFRSLAPVVVFDGAETAAPGAGAGAEAEVVIDAEADVNTFAATVGGDSTPLCFEDEWPDFELEDWFVVEGAGEIPGTCTLPLEAAALALENCSALADACESGRGREFFDEPFVVLLLLLAVSVVECMCAGFGGIHTLCF